MLEEEVLAGVGDVCWVGDDADRARFDGGASTSESSSSSASKNTETLLMAYVVISPPKSISDKNEVAGCVV
jgi:hypothetical protein